MKTITTQAIVLSRTDFSEADRIITFLTPDHGKIKGLARGVRKTKSKLAGGIELFSVSDISYIVGRSEISTITSTRLVKHYGHIVKNLDRTNAGYEYIKILNKLTEDHPESAYFELLVTAFESLDDDTINLDLISLWFKAQLLNLAGHSPDLVSNHEGRKLEPNGQYMFNFETMSFVESAGNDMNFDVNAIKFLRLVFGKHTPKSLNRVKGVTSLAKSTAPIINTVFASNSSR